MNKLKQHLRALLRDKRGSGVVMVLIAMFFVSLLGGTLLYMSYIGLRMRVAQRKGTETFYSAETILQQIEAGLQQAVSDSIADAYAETMVHYSALSGSADPVTAVNAQFKQAFKDALLGWEYSYTQPDGTDTEKALFGNTGGSYTYKTDCLIAFLDAAVVDDTDLSTGGSDGGVAIETADDGTTTAIVLKNLRVSYTDGAYNSVISTDLVITVPDFQTLFAEYTVAGVPDFALVARDTLTQNAGAVALTVDGSAYAGQVTLDKTGSNLTLQGGTLICAKDMALTSAAADGTSQTKFTLETGATLWAKRLVLNVNAVASVKGTAFVQDDLALEGAKSAFTLSGSYFGFGNSATDSSKSSSIVVNGRNTTLDLSKATQLVLAGHSFISSGVVNDANPVTNDVLMGESLSVKTNQQIYLIPASELNGVTTNPTTYVGTTPPPVSWRDSGNHPGQTIKQVIKVLPGAIGTKLCYYFVDFGANEDNAVEAVEKANQYFADYFSSNPDQITSYLAMYTDLEAATGITRTAGWTLVENGDGTYSLGSEPVTNSASLGNPSARNTAFEQLCKTLSTTNPGSTATNPYEYIVDTSKIDTVLTGSTPELKFENASNQVVAVIKKGDYTIGTTSSADLCLLLATGDVTVDKNFTGLIVAGETITLGGSVTAISANAEAVMDAFNATCEVDGDTYRFSDFLNISAGAITDEVADTGDNWSPDTLISYRNWQKS